MSTLSSPPLLSSVVQYSIPTASAAPDIYIIQLYIYNIYYILSLFFKYQNEYLIGLANELGVDTTEGLDYNLRLFINEYGGSVSFPPVQ